MCLVPLSVDFTWNIAQWACGFIYSKTSSRHFPNVHFISYLCTVREKLLGLTSPLILQIWA